MIRGKEKERKKINKTYKNKKLLKQQEIRRKGFGSKDNKRNK